MKKRKRRKKKRKKEKKQDSPFVKSMQAFVHPHLLDDIRRTTIRLAGIIRLQAGANNLIGIGDATGKHLAHGAQGEIIPIAEFVGGAQMGASLVLELLVGHELDGAVGHAEQGRQQAAVEATRALGLQDGAHAMRDALVGAGGVAAGGEHACLDDPDGVGADRGEDAFWRVVFASAFPASSRDEEESKKKKVAIRTRNPGSCKVVERRQAAGRAVPGLDEFFDVAVPASRVIVGCPV